MIEIKAGAATAVTAPWQRMIAADSILRTYSQTLDAIKRS